MKKLPIPTCPESPKPNETKNKPKTSVWRWTVDSSVKRADVLLHHALSQGLGECTDAIPPLSRSQIQRLIALEKVTADQVPIKARTPLKPGMKLQIILPEPEPTELVPEDRPLDVLFEDDQILVINKPAGLTVHPSPTQMKGTLVHALLHHIQDLSGIGGVLRPGIVHRLDKNTSGALVVTKTDRAHQQLAEVFAKHEIERSYWALCFGSPSMPNPGPIKIESLIGRSPSDRKKMTTQVKTGKRAVTYVKKLQEFGLPGKPAFASWLEITLETGRTHQIRVHLTGMNHSLLGDPTYGTPTLPQAKWQNLPESIKSEINGLPGQALHARSLGFKHPTTGHFVRFEAPPPLEFANVLNALKKYSI